MWEYGVMTAVLDYAPHVSTSKSWITRQQAAKLLDLSLQTVDRYVKAGIIASRKNDLTKRVTLSADDVDKVKRGRAEA
jgi:predicted site-specific integrase-resolvase